MEPIKEVYHLLELLDYTKSEIEYGICKALENHRESRSDDMMIMNYAIMYIERDVKRNVKYMGEI